eukprot:CAMPEP_0204292464 /NCGR_PEP_ID=MMETSP0468-20130131/64392_1 /ASSEMBLY_ACC=CAM_ASM_000383 /TAXON_ID=2969 /ORGANISM="Oxyrrhis marina" /LENGTH=68 /DNA_ID=CAMNT_0051270851 /DNA_START=298 /DNA_END=502 /DNA_ORIENTATION=-
MRSNGSGSEAAAVELGVLWYGPGEAVVFVDAADAPCHVVCSLGIPGVSPPAEYHSATNFVPPRADPRP